MFRVSISWVYAVQSRSVYLMYATLEEALVAFNSAPGYAETAVQFGVTTQTVWAWCKAGKLRALRAGTTVRIDPASIAELLAERQSA